MRGASVGIDVGGTFTDLVAIDADGAVTARKVPSTPADQSRGVLEALDALGESPAAVARLVHGTTVATNTLLERTGARVTLCATEGATDLLALRRQERASLYDLARQHPDPLVPAERCIAVPERIEPQGVVRRLDEAGAEAAARATLGTEPAIVAVSLLHAYGNPAHERAMAAALSRVAPGMDVVCSTDVLPEIREYERTATTVAEAYLRPAVAGYVARLAAALGERGYPALAVMTSAGGMRPAAETARGAASLALSGPAGGVVGAAFVARLTGVRDALTIDIGGTSADAGVIVDGQAMVDAGGDVAGVPIALPRVLVDTVSAGGGSIGWVDDGGALRVGPRSAGVAPGPAAFGRGGTEATVTDAHIVLGNVRETRLSGGVTLRADLARAAVERLAARAGATPERVAAAMVRAADAAMARALRRVSVERGIDPRRSTLVAFGGGGPLHACALAEHLSMRRVLVPPFAGVLSALGLGVAAERRDVLASVMRRADTLSDAETRALAGRLASPGLNAAERQWWARARYEGQGHELEVPFIPGEPGSSVSARFAAAHDARYGFVLDRPVEIVAARHTMLGEPRDARLARAGDARGEMRGPCVLALPHATLLVGEGWRGTALPIGGWILERDA
ncbi:MAG TPA: hydantoinase/oxoprolinase family protein [Gemmatimonadaceae bacterium]